MNNNGEDLYKLFNQAMKKEFNIRFSVEEAKIIFDALSSHRFKIAQKRANLSDNPAVKQDQDEVRKFMNQRLDAIEKEIEKTDKIFQKIGKYMKED